MDSRWVHRIDRLDFSMKSLFSSRLYTTGQGSWKGFDPDKAVSLLRRAAIVVVDVDSTIIRKEGIDMLASFLHKENDLKELKQR